MKNNLDKTSILYIPIFGGIGNQMFQLANAINLAEQGNYEIKLIDFTKSIGSIERNWNLDCFGFKPSKVSFFRKEYIKILVKISNFAFKLGFKNSFGVLNEVHIQKKKV